MSRDSPQLNDHAAAPLDQWIAMRGPLSPGVALVVALDACERASRMADSELAASAGSLTMTRIFRSTAGRWQWMPMRVGSPAPRVSDAEIIERLGALLFHCVIGRAIGGPFADEHSVRTRLRSLRQELPPGVADLTVRALTARRSGPRTLDALARDVRHVLGTAQQMARPGSRRTMIVLGAATTAFVLVVGMWWMSARSNDRIESHGLTKRETALVDVTEETAQGFAMADEHTVAIQEYQQLLRWLTPRLAPEDPRLAWNAAHDAWVRTLRGDRLTTEQVLGVAEGATSRLEATLGDHHPYTRAARLELATTLQARGALLEAASLRDQAEKAVRSLVGDTSNLLPGIPAPPGVVAHAAPNIPEREGFRRTNGGGFFVPLTSIQRLLAGRDGWRLHLLASGACRASVITGNTPRRIAVDMTRAADDSWEMRVDGVTPPLTLRGGASEKPAVSLVASGNGIEARLWDGRVITRKVDDAAPAPDPPYAFAFAGGTNGSGCELVWLEIPFPFQPK